MKFALNRTNVDWEVRSVYRTMNHGGTSALWTLKSRQRKRIDKGWQLQGIQCARIGSSYALRTIGGVLRGRAAAHKSCRSCQAALK